MIENKVHQANHLCASLAEVFPYPIVTFGLDKEKGYDMTFTIDKNRYFNKQNNCDFISADDIYERLKKKSPLDLDIVQKSENRAED